LAGGLLGAGQQSPYESAPILYSQTRPKDRVSELEAKIDQGQVKLVFRDAHGYLESFLSEMGIPSSSQSLVFSKTSFQRHRISPRWPRAIYFTEDVYVGWVPGGEVMEVSTVDPDLGAVFYTLAQKPGARPRFVRQTDNCLQCHDSTGLTLGVPGHVVRSVYPGGDGMPHFDRGTYRTTDQSPYSERWGGWYVTGDHGSLRHMGNVTYPDDPNLDPSPFGQRGANWQDLSSRVDLESYLGATSDIVALMVLEHQTAVHNLITRANHETRIAVRQSEEMNRALGLPPGTLTEGGRSRLRSACEPLLEALFFSGEAPLPDRVKGNSTFASDFEKRGPFDSRGRTLRRFDLHHRLFRYPLSYLIYSKAFAGLPPEALGYLSGRLREVLVNKDQGKPFAHLLLEDRAQLLEIVSETLPWLTAHWK
jgi:hypothetical protein